jgi:hypothetical protein
MFTHATHNKILRTTATLALAWAGLTGTVAHADNLNPILGGGLGAMAGALIGQSMGGRDGAMIGAAVGGVAGVSIASNGERRRNEPVHNVVYEQPYRQVPVQGPVYGYREVERVNYYPVHDYGRHGWGGHERGWERHDEYRRDWDHRGGDHRGWERRD